MHLEHAGLFATEQRQYAVRGGLGDRLLPINPALELAHLLVVLVDTTCKAGRKKRLAAKYVAHTVADGGIFADTLGDDVARTLQHLVVPILPLSTHNRIGHRLVALLYGYGGTCATFGAVRQVEVLQGGETVGCVDLLAQFGCHLALLLDALHYSFATLVEFLEFEQHVANGGNLHLVEATRHLLAVARYERYRGALFQQLDGLLHLALSKLQATGYDGGVVHFSSNFLISGGMTSDLPVERR